MAAASLPRHGALASEPGSPHTLHECITASSARAIAVIGLAKNAGKTTTVNALLAASPERLGLTSLGLDGETTDHLTGLAKPRIRPPAGTLIATTEGSLERSRSTLDIVEQLPFRTSLGHVLIGRADGSSEVEVSGPTTLAELRATVERLRVHGAHRVLVDGAINRLGSASPRVTDAFVLATGGTVADTIEGVVESTCAALDLLTLPQVPQVDFAQLSGLADRGSGLVSLDGGRRIVEVTPSANLGSGASAVRSIRQLGTTTLLVRGALTEGFLDDLVRLLPPRPRLRIVVRDATTIVAPARTLGRCRGAGIAVQVLVPLHLLAITLNPFRQPRPYPARQFFATCARELGDRAPIYDIVCGYGSNPNDDRSSPSNA